MNETTWRKRKMPLGLRIIAALLLPLQAMTGMPVYAVGVNGGGGPAPVVTPQHVKAKKGDRKVKLVDPSLHFSKNIPDVELRMARVFPEPLIPLAGDPIAGENAALAQALVAYKAANSAEAVGALDDFLQAYPGSRWRASLELSLGELRYETGYFSQALGYYKSAWKLAKKENGIEQKATADRAFGELVLLEAKLGQVENLQRDFAEAKDRDIGGSSADRVRGAQDGYHTMLHHPEVAFKCGPYAINSIKNIGKKAQGREAEVEKMPSSRKGTSLAQVKELSDRVKLHYQMAKRTEVGALIVPSVIHWKVGHFAAIVAQKNNRYLIKDPTFGGGEVWMSQAAINSESSGYFLIPPGALPAGWQSVPEKEGKTVWGRGGAKTRQDASANSTCDCPRGAGSTDLPGGSGLPTAMPQASVYKMQAVQRLDDMPIGYRPPYGPAIGFPISYSYLESNQPANFSFTNIGLNWSFAWTVYVTVDASQNATVVLGGGGTEVYNYSTTLNNVDGVYAPNLMSQAVLAPIGGGYERRLPNGSKEVFTQHDGTGRYFLTQAVDPQGNAATLHYDALMRLTDIVDALGQQTTFTYVSNAITVEATPPPNPTYTYVGPYFQLAKITDPFGRTASFAYDAGGILYIGGYSSPQLSQVTDEIGMSSQFTYDTGTFLDQLTTPYGKTLFYQYVPSSDGTATARGLVVVFPDQSKVGVENWMQHTLNTYYWDRKAMETSPGDVTKAETTHWLLEPASNVEAEVPQSVQPALEGVTTYLYPDEPAAVHDDPSDPITELHSYTGVSNRPSSIIRPAVGGSTATWSYSYNDFGRITQAIDPMGRTITYSYAANNIDLMEVRGAGNALLGKWTYNGQHRPLTHIDGSGQKTLYTWNNQGQLLTVTDAKSGVTTLSYTGGYPTQIDGPLSGSNDATTLTWDAYNRVRTVTDSEGYARTYDYDFLDRPTQTTYPDGTSEQVTWSKLDPVFLKDRDNHWTSRSYDAGRHLLSETDPQGRTTTYGWCSCGSLVSLTDPNGNTTGWQRDLESRVTRKTFADGTHTDYAYDNVLGLLQSETDALGQTKAYSYNLDDTVSRVAYSGAAHATSDVTYGYDADFPRLSTVSNGLGAVSYTYNAYVTDPLASPVTGGGRLAGFSNSTLTDPSGADTGVAFTYDELGRVTDRTTGGSANHENWVYDAMGRVTALDNALGAFAYAYVDPSYGTDRLASVIYPTGQKILYTYYGNSGDQRLQQISNQTSASAVLSQFGYAYDPAGNITKWTQQTGSAAAQRYDLAYDKADQLIAAVLKTDSTSAVLKQNYYGYDPAGNRTQSQVDTVTSHGTYNSVNELTNVLGGGPVRIQGTVSKPSTVTVNGSAASQPTSTNFWANPVLTLGDNTVSVVATDGSGNAKTNNYTVNVGNSGQNRLSSFNFENASLAGDRGQLPTHATAVTRSASSDGQGVTVSATAGSLLTYKQTEADGSPNISLDQGTVSMLFTPNWTSGDQGGTGPQQWSRLIELGGYTSDASAPFWDFDFDPDGTSIDFNIYYQGSINSYRTYLSLQQGHTYRFTMTYNATACAFYIDGSLASTSGGITVHPPFTPPGQMAIGSDNGGGEQVNGQIDDVQFFNYPMSATQVAGLGSPANTAPTYDADGNMTSDGQGKSYQWDAENRLIQISQGGNTYAFAYDGLGRRVSETDNGTLTKQWLWNGAQLAEERNATGAVTKRFFEQGEQIAGADYFYTRDHLGSVREMTDFSGTVQARYSYDAYGMAIKVSGSLDADFQYAGMQYFPAFGLSGPWGRFYDAGLARWLSRDPLAGYSPEPFDGAELQQGPNLYAYVGNNPLKWIDPLGLFDAGGDFNPDGSSRDQGLHDQTADILNSFLPSPEGMAESAGLPLLKSAACTMASKASQLLNKYPAFRRWFHKNWKPSQKIPAKGKHNPDMSNQDVQDAFEEWNSTGKPGAK